MLAQARRVVFVSTQNRHYVEDRIGVRRPEHFQVILPGVDVSQYHSGLRDRIQQWRSHYFPSLDPARRWLLFAGHNFEGKGLLRILEALGGHAAHQDWHLLVFGEDAANQFAAEALAGRAAPGQVLLLGRDSRLVQAYGLSDCLVMDSVSEGFPLVLLEAMASGSVPVVTRFGGVSDIVADGATGIIRDNAAGVAEAALTLSPDRLRALSEAGTRSVSQRTWTSVAAEYAECYAIVQRGE